MSPVTQHYAADLTKAQARAVVALQASVWPLPSATLDTQVTAFLQAARKPGTAVLHYVVWDGEQAAGHAEGFERIIRHPGGPLRVMALAGVCTAPAHRGKGLGAAVVRAAFARVDGGVFPVSLFQTRVPAFYEKLGARCVSNRFVNTLNTEAPDTNPWRDDHVMIYPASYPWPDGTIDLNGPGY